MSFTEELMLPSRGIVYRNADFNGVVKVKPFTTKAYKDLLTANASETGLKQFIDTCLVDCPIKAKNMNQNDLLAILFKIRVMTLGNKLKTQIVCPECNNAEDAEWDLNSVAINYLYIDDDKYPIDVTLPCSNEKIKIRFLTGADSIKAKQEAERRAALFKKQVSEFLDIYTVVSTIDVDGKDIVEKADWYEHLNPHDSIFLDQVFSEMNNAFGVELAHECHCSKCDAVFKSYISIGSDFFRPYANFSLGITSKAGNLESIVKEPDILSEAREHID